MRIESAAEWKSGEKPLFTPGIEVAERQAVRPRFRPTEETHFFTGALPFVNLYCSGSFLLY